MSNKIKVLTVMFDVTYLDDNAIATLKQNVEAQGEDFEIVEDGEYSDKWVCADVLNTSVREVDAEDQ